MHSLNRMVLVGTVENIQSKIIHIVEVANTGKVYPRCLCGAITLSASSFNQSYDYFIGNVDISGSSDEATCKSCKRILRDIKENPEYEVYGHKNHNKAMVGKIADDYYYIRNLISFARIFKERYENRNCNYMRESQGKCICVFPLDGSNANGCHWIRCNKIYDVLIHRPDNKKELTEFMSAGPAGVSAQSGHINIKDGVKYIKVSHGEFKDEFFFEEKPEDQLKAAKMLRELANVLEAEDDTCEACFAEKEGSCVECDSYNSYPNFLSEEDYNDTGVGEKDREDAPCPHCANTQTNRSNWPCSSCYEKRSWKYFSPKEPRNGLVEMPFGISQKVLYTYPDGDRTCDAPTFENALFWARRSLLRNIFSSVTDVESDSAIEDVLSALCKEPGKYLEILTTILKEVKPEGVK